jgi:aarF domain-containing kinase
MTVIDGARVDDLKYLKDHGIDRNQVSQELSKIFSQMVYINGCEYSIRSYVASPDFFADFHADPHHGNLLIRLKAPNSSSPYKFDVVLLDHGQYFDIPDDLRVNYARFWLSLIAGNSPEVMAQRRKYARLVANISDDLVSRFA